MAERKRVELVIPAHNRRELTLQCLRSLQRVESDGLIVHIIVVDDGSTDGTSEAVSKHFPNVEVVLGDGSLFFTAATNLGIRTALKREPDYIVTMNDDAVFAPDFLKSLIHTAEENPRTIVGALLLLWDLPHRVFQVSPRWETFSGGYRHWKNQTVWTVPDEPWEVELIVGNCVAFPVQAFHECGLMDERRFPQYGDAEYTPRLKRNGWRLLVDPGARVFCQPNDPPKRLRHRSLAQALKTVFKDKYSGHSVRRRFYANVLGGPSKFKGLVAFAVFYIRWAVGRSLEGDYGRDLQEPRLVDLFGARKSASPRPERF